MLGVHRSPLYVHGGGCRACCMPAACLCRQQLTAAISAITGNNRASQPAVPRRQLPTWLLLTTARVCCSMPRRRAPAQPALARFRRNSSTLRPGYAVLQQACTPACARQEPCASCLTRPSAQGRTCTQPTTSTTGTHDAPPVYTRWFVPLCLFPTLPLTPAATPARPLPAPEGRLPQRVQLGPGPHLLLLALAAAPLPTCASAAAWPRQATR